MLHTNDALGSVERLQDLGVSPFLIATTVRLFQAQRLVRTLCPHCGTKRRLTGDDLQRKVAASRLASDAERFWASGVTIYEPAGCPRCEYTGYYGRLAVMEMAVVTPGLVSAIEARLPSRELGEIARQNGYRPMVEQGVDLVCAGRTTLSEVESISLNAFGDGQGNSLSPPKADASSPSLEQQGRQNEESGQERNRAFLYRSRRRACSESWRRWFIGMVDWRPYRCEHLKPFIGKARVVAFFGK